MDTHESEYDNGSHGLAIQLHIGAEASAEATIQLLKKAIGWLELAGDSIIVRGQIEFAERTIKRKDQAEPDHEPEPAAMETDYHFPPFRG